jgi:hypothetical protein
MLVPFEDWIVEGNCHGNCNDGKEARRRGGRRNCSCTPSLPYDSFLFLFFLLLHVAFAFLCSPRLRASAPPFRQLQLLWQLQLL